MYLIKDNSVILSDIKFAGALFVLIICWSCGQCMDDYCKLTCGNKKNSACKSNCSSIDCQLIDSDKDFRQAMLDVHNEKRDSVASGNAGIESGAGADMYFLNYDLGLEFAVACWLGRTCKSISDECRRTPKFTTAGQTIYLGRDIDVKDAQTSKQVIETWYSQISFLNKQLIDWYFPSHETSKVAQMIWGKTSHIGCARAKRSDGMYLLGCNYGPAGNQAGKHIYTRGDPASKCPGGSSANSKYYSLCGSVSNPDGFDSAGNQQLKDQIAANRASITSRISIAYVFFISLAFLLNKELIAQNL